MRTPDRGNVRSAGRCSCVWRPRTILLPSIDGPTSPSSLSASSSQPSAGAARAAPRPAAPAAARAPAPRRAAASRLSSSPLVVVPRRGRASTPLPRPLAAVAGDIDPDNASVLVCGGGGVALEVARRLKDAGAWVWMLQRSDIRR
jgi:hypothetical protein